MSVDEGGGDRSLHCSQMTVRGVDGLRVQLARSRQVWEVIDVCIRLDGGRLALRFIETKVFLEALPFSLHIRDRDACISRYVPKVFRDFGFQMFGRKKDYHACDDCFMDCTAI